MSNRLQIGTYIQSANTINILRDELRMPLYSQSVTINTINSRTANIVDYADYTLVSLINQLLVDMQEI